MSHGLAASWYHRRRSDQTLEVAFLADAAKLHSTPEGR